MKGTKSDFHGQFFLATSLVGLCMLAVMTFLSPSPETIPPWQAPVVNSLFVLICLSGIVAGISPSTCSSLFGSLAGHREHTTIAMPSPNATGEKKGHHPDCGSFSMHTFQFRGKTYCAGCTGLVIGAVVSILGTVAYFILAPQWGQIGWLLFWLGFLGVSLGLLQHGLRIFRKNYAHGLLGVTFVFGAFLVFIGIEEISNNLIVEGYFLVLSLFWIVTRVILSQEEHRRICDECGRSDCGFT